MLVRLVVSHQMGSAGQRCNGGRRVIQPTQSYQPLVPNIACPTRCRDEPAGASESALAATLTVPQEARARARAVNVLVVYGKLDASMIDNSAKVLFARDLNGQTGRLHLSVNLKRRLSTWCAAQCATKMLAASQLSVTGVTGLDFTRTATSPGMYFLAMESRT